VFPKGGDTYHNSLSSEFLYHRIWQAPDKTKRSQNPKPDACRQFGIESGFKYGSDYGSEAPAACFPNYRSMMYVVNLQ